MPVAILATVGSLAACRGGGRSEEPGGERIAVVIWNGGASAEGVEAEVVVPIERAVSGLDGVRDVRSIAREGAGVVDVTFRRGVDGMTAAAAVRDRIAAVQRELPSAMPPPIVMRAPASQAWVYATLEEPARTTEVRRVIERVPGAARVDICGERRGVVALELSPEHLATTGVTPVEVADAITAQNVDVPAGRIEAGPGAITLRVTGGAQSFDEIANVVVAQRGDAVVRVRDVAAITNRSQADCVAIGAPGDTLIRVGLQAVRDRTRVEKALREARARVIDGTMMLRDVEWAGTVTERIDAARAMIGRAGAGSYAAVPRDGDGFQLVMRRPASRLRNRWTGPIAEAVLVGEDLEPLVAAADKARAALRANPQIVLVGERGAAARPELRLEIDRARAADLGVPVEAIARTLALGGGARVAGLTSGGEQLDVVVSLDGGGDDFWRTLHVRGADGALVPLAAVVSAEAANEPAHILRLDGRRAVVVWAQADVDTSSAELHRILRDALPGAKVGDVDPRNVADEHW